MLSRPSLTALLAGENYSPEAQALFARMVVQPDGRRKRLIDQFISGLKVDGLWTMLDVLHVFAAQTSQQALLNWKSTDFNASGVSSPTFTADRGYTTDGVSTKIDMNYRPSDGQQNAQEVGFYSTTSAQATGSGFGTYTSSGITIWSRNASNALTGRLNLASGPTSTNGSVTNGAGLSSSGRSASNSSYVRRNGVSLAGSSTLSVAPLTLVMQYGGVGAGFVAQQFTLGYAGRNFDATQAINFYNRIMVFLTAIGAN